MTFTVRQYPGTNTGMTIELSTRVKFSVLGTNTGMTIDLSTTMKFSVLTCTIYSLVNIIEHLDRNYQRLPQDLVNNRQLNLIFVDVFFSILSKAEHCKSKIGSSVIFNQDFMRGAFLLVKTKNYAVRLRILSGISWRQYCSSTADSMIQSIAYQCL